MSAAGIRTIESSSTKLVSAFGFSNGIAELTLKKPPPLVPSCLIATCEATGPRARACWAPSSVFAPTAPPRVWTTPWETRISPTIDRERQQHVVEGPGQVLPEVAEPGAVAADDAADQRQQRAGADRGGDEVLHREPGHLREVGERRFAAVVLPVGVGDERGGGVEADVPGAGVEAFGVERLDPLGAQDQVEDDPGEDREEDQALRVALPVLFLAGIDPQHPVGEPLDRPEDGAEEDPLAGVDARHVGTERRRQRDHDGDEDGDLQPALGHQRFSPRSSA